jgi:protoheme IX farnesyltransferase
VVEQHIDAKMARTCLAADRQGPAHQHPDADFSALLCAAGSALLYVVVNPLTMWLTFATFVGYAVIYTVVLKPLTPQNIVIGGASGAMPPVLGWAAIRGEVGAEALIMCLIIFLWTPPHFWALALYRAEDYRKSGCRCCRSRTARSSRGCTCSCTRWCCSRHLAAVRLGHERAGLRGLCGRARRDLHRLRVAPAAGLLRHAGAQDLPLFDLHLSLLFAALLVDHYLSRCYEPASVLLLCWPSRCWRVRQARPVAPNGALVQGRRHHRRRLPVRADRPERPARTPADFKGKVTVVFFGYTQCPDVCPTTMAELAQVKKALGKDGERLQGVFITSTRSATRRRC